MLHQPATIPFWPLAIQGFQALSLLVIGAVGAWIAYQQAVSARIKLQHDLFDKRKAVFDAVIDLLLKTMAITSNEKGLNSRFAMLNEFHAKTNDATFLFREDVNLYIDILVNKCSVYITNELRVHNIKSTVSEVDRSSIFNSSTEALHWMLAQIQGDAKLVFKPYMEIPLVSGLSPGRDLASVLIWLSRQVVSPFWRVGQVARQQMLRWK